MEEKERQTCPHSAPEDEDMADRPTEGEKTAHLHHTTEPNGVQLSKVKSVMAANPHPELKLALAE